VTVEEPPSSSDALLVESIASSGAGERGVAFDPTEQRAGHRVGRVPERLGLG
jgi:hypothetical protein